MKKQKPNTFTVQGAWNAGKAAFKAGEPVSKNPYNYNTTDFDAWVNGWLTAQTFALK